MTAKRKTLKGSAPLPSGHAGVYRAGAQWEAYVMDKDLIRLGTYPTIREAVAARAKYWKIHGAQKPAGGQNGVGR